MGGSDSGKAELFLCSTPGPTINFPTTDFQQIRPRHVDQCPNKDFQKKEFSKIFTFMGHLPSKTSKLNGSYRYGTLLWPANGSGDALQRHCSVHVVVLRSLVKFLYDIHIQFQSYGPQSSAIFFILPFFRYKMPKTYLPVTSLQPRGYIAECFQLFHVAV